VNLQWATVLGTSPLTILIDGSDTPVPALKLPGYTPAEADRVLWVVAPAAGKGRQLVVLGTAI
jgi:hypothetical protein